MKFALRTSKYWYNNKDKKRLEKLGFIFEKETKYLDIRKEWYKDDYNVDPPLIEVNTLKELIDFQKEWGDIIIQKGEKNGEIIYIEIYDGYRE